MRDGQSVTRKGVEMEEADYLSNRIFLFHKGGIDMSSFLVVRYAQHLY